MTRKYSLFVSLEHWIWGPRVCHFLLLKDSSSLGVRVCARVCTVVSMCIDVCAGVCV